MQYDELHYANSQYPTLLREMQQLAPPSKLYVRGQLSQQPLVAIVGTRRPIDYGRQVTFSLARDLAAAGLGIVSGLAIGIDSMAHRGALEAGGYTLAVLGSGLGREQPSTNAALGRQVVASGGALLTDYKPGVPPLKQHFPARNRIIAGLSLAVVVTEAAAKSGAFYTTNAALAENRQVMAVPGNITSRVSTGTNQLLREGATPITCAKDVLDELNLDARQLPASERPIQTPANATEARLLELIAGGTTTSRELIAASGLGAAAFARTISLMEITGKVRNLGAGVWVRR